MSSTGKVIVAIIIVAAIAGGAVLLNQKSKDESTSDASTTQGSGSTDSSNTNNKTDTGSGNDNGNQIMEVTIKYDGSSFSLSSDKIMAGGTVTVVNNSDNELEFDSDPHPVHTDNPELNAGAIAPGESKKFVLEKKGTWGFHNHLDSSQRGQLTVE